MSSRLVGGVQTQARAASANSNRGPKPSVSDCVQARVLTGQRNAYKNATPRARTRPSVEGTSLTAASGSAASGSGSAASGSAGVCELMHMCTGAACNPREPKQRAQRKRLHTCMVQPSSLNSRARVALSATCLCPRQARVGGLWAAAGCGTTGSQAPAGRQAGRQASHSAKPQVEVCSARAGRGTASSYH